MFSFALSIFTNVNMVEAQSVTKKGTEVDGVKPIAYLNMQDDFASATFSWSHSGGGKNLTAYYYYKLGNSKYYSIGYGDIAGNAVTTTIVRKVSGAESKGAKSINTLNYNDVTSTLTATLGSVPSSLFGWIKK